jgi:hypothetical protein
MSAYVNSRGIHDSPRLGPRRNVHHGISCETSEALCLCWSRLNHHFDEVEPTMDCLSDWMFNLIGKVNYALYLEFGAYLDLMKFEVLRGLKFNVDYDKIHSFYTTICQVMNNQLSKIYRK